MKNSPVISPRLRSDLASVQVRSRKRFYRIVIDEIAGRFTRVSEQIWNQLCSDEPYDQDLAQQARTAGLLRERTAASKRRFSLLAIRIPIGSIDNIANWLAPRTGVLFAPAAICFWCITMLTVAVMVLARSSQLVVDLRGVSAYLNSQSVIAFGICFVVTKALHELGHAVMCRRINSRCGNVGVYLFCGFPCPYCDVTDVWRQSSTTKRIAVMLAGIYIELIVASIAGIVWMSSVDPTTRLAALNIMLVCSISTLLFNANPLMRYDGYYVLGDLMDSTNLRSESLSAFRAVVISRFAGAGYSIRQRLDLRSALLAIYWFLSRVYRIFVTLAIAAFVVTAASWFQLHGLASLALAVAAVAIVARSIGKAAGVLTGRNHWAAVSKWRRAGTLCLFAALMAAFLFVPFPRHQKLAGQVESRDSLVVFAPNNGLIQDVSLEFGDQVSEAQSLMQLADESVRLEQLSLQADLRMAKIRLENSHRQALATSSQARPDVTKHWDVLQAACDSIASQLDGVQQRLSMSKITAPSDGFLIPAVGDSAPSTLAELNGKEAITGRPICEIAKNGQLQATLVLDAKNRSQVRHGTVVRVSLHSDPTHVIETEIQSVSSIVQAQNGVIQTSAYRVLCPLPDVPPQDLLLWVGQRCHGSAKLGSRSVASDIKTWMQNCFNG